MEYNVNAVVVTYNRLNLLKECIAALLNQDYRLKKIFIINNASTDGTKDYLDSLKDDRLAIIHKDKNEGGAGGFYYGMKAAYEDSCDFVWIMDDDTVPTPGALMELINSYKLLGGNEIGFLASNVKFKDGSPCFMNICNTNFNWGEFAEHGIIRVNHCSFVSALIPTSVIKEFGYPIKEYFVWGDDGEYSTRLLLKYKGYVCTKSIVYHLMNENVGVDIINVDKSRIGRFYYFYRNWVCTHLMRNQRDADNFINDTKRFIKRLHKERKWIPFTKEKIKIIKKGIRDGKKFKVTIDYPDDAINKFEIVPIKNTFKVKVKRVLKRVILRFFRSVREIEYTKGLYYGHYKKLNTSKFDRILFLKKCMFNSRIFFEGSKEENLFNLLKKTKIKHCKSSHFIYSVDVYKNWQIHQRQMANCTVDYELILNNSLESLRMNDESDFAKRNNKVIDALSVYNNRLIKYTKTHCVKNKKEIIKSLNNMKTKPASGFVDALQRILFLNSVMWQTRHIQMGLGRLDVLLEKYSEELTDEYILDVLKDFITVLHNYYWLKSEEMPGDTGQIIILGGYDHNGKTVDNRLTQLFIKAIHELQLPDPKVLLRTTKKTSSETLKLAAECLATGVGCPLISNDERVLPCLKRFGYDKTDAVDYVTSACWEIIPKNSAEQNNIGVFDFNAALDLLGKKNDLSSIDNWDFFMFLYKAHLTGHLQFMIGLVNGIRWDEDPLMSSFLSICRENKNDIGRGGAKYNNYGMLSVGLATAVNSLRHIKEYVFKKKKYSLKEFFNIKNANFVGHEALMEELKDNSNGFGDDTNKEALGIANELLETVNKVFEETHNMFGGQIKFGLSSPGYIAMGKFTYASFDGRRDGEPYAVHISNDQIKNPLSLVNFAGKLDYGKYGFNGDVVDMTFSPILIKNNIDKFVEFLEGFIAANAFQLQINVISSKVLIEAKKNPKLYPNLIVRVWGFSAYFNDLPEEYKDYLIHRLLENEKASNL